MTADPDTFDLETLRRTARVAGFAWSDTELDAVRALVAQASAALRALESLPLRDVEPTVQYRIL